MGAATDAEVAAAEARKAEIAHFYDDSERLVASNCEMIWMGVIRSRIDMDVYNELQAAGIENRGESNLGWDDVTVPVRDLHETRAILLRIRRQREGVDWIRGVDPPWIDHLKSGFGQTTQQP